MKNKMSELCQSHNDKHVTVTQGERKEEFLTVNVLL